MHTRTSQTGAGSILSFTGWKGPEFTSMALDYRVPTSLLWLVINPLRPRKHPPFRMGRPFVTSCHQEIMLRPNTVTQCHNIELSGENVKRHPGNFPVNTQRHMPGGKRAFTPHPSEHGFAMFLEERERGWIGS